MAELGNSARFMRFLKKRSKEKGATSIEQFADELAEKMHNMSVQRTHVAPKPLRAPSARGKRSLRRG